MAGSANDIIDNLAQKLAVVTGEAVEGVHCLADEYQARCLVSAGMTLLTLCVLWGTALFMVKRFAKSDDPETAVFGPIATAVVAALASAFGLAFLGSYLAQAVSPHLGVIQELLR